MERVFEVSDSDAPTYYPIGRMAAPFCASCLTRHYAERPPIRFLDRALMMFRTSEVLSGLAPAATALFFVYVSLPRLLRFDVVSMAFIGGLSAFFFFIAYWGFKAAWEKSERFAVRRVLDQTIASGPVGELF